MCVPAWGLCACVRCVCLRAFLCVFLCAFLRAFLRAVCARSSFGTQNACMCVSARILMRACLHPPVCASLSANISLCVHSCLHLCSCIRVCTPSYAFIPACYQFECVCMHLCACVPACFYVCVSARILAFWHFCTSISAC